MRLQIFAGYIGCMLLVLSGAVPCIAQDLTAGEIVARSNDLDKLPSWSAELFIRMFSKGSTERIRNSVIHSELSGGGHDPMRLIQFTAPADISGTNVLIHEHSKADDDIWIYLPSLEKVRRLIAGNQKDSFVGTDFSYSDILTPKSSDYNYTLDGREMIDNVECYRIHAEPITEDVAVRTGYSRYISWIRTDSFLRIKSDYFDLSGSEYKTMHVYSAVQIKDFPGKWLIEKVEMTNLQSGHSTMMTFNNIEVGRKYSNVFFSPSRLNRQ